MSKLRLYGTLLEGSEKPLQAASLKAKGEILKRTNKRNSSAIQKARPK